MPAMTPRLFVLRRGVPVPLLVAAGACLVVGIGLIAWSPTGPALVIGIIVLALGLLADGLAVFRMMTGAQQITLDQTGIRLGSPRPADVGWDEVTAVQATGRILHIQLRDHTSMVVDGESYPRGFAEFQADLVGWLEAMARPR
jgi:hypothetical protein